ncbi:MAG: hypothetical protein AB7P01_13025 [Bacteroidia bacterium]
MAVQQTTVSINLFGTGCTIVCGALQNKYWKKIHQEINKNNLLLEQFMASENNLRYMDFQGLRTWKDISNEFSINGMLNSVSSTIEIKLGDSKKTNIPFREISQQEILFPVYASEHINKTLVSKSIFHSKRLIMVETEVGKLGTIKFSIPDFNIDKLVFHITDVKVNEVISYTVLGKITYAGKALQATKSDTLVTGFYCLV